MRKILIAVNTYYQLIMAMQMKQKLFNNDYVSVLMSNHSNNSYNVFKRLRDSKYFDECVFVKSKGILTNRNLKQKINEIFELSFGSKNIYEFYLNDLKNLYYDEYISYNLEVDNYGIFSILSSYNKNLVYSSYEEGVLSYNSFYYDSLKFKLIRIIRKIIGKSNIFDKYEKFYCMYPELFKGDLKAVEIPAISKQDEQLKNALCQIFDLKKNNSYSGIDYIYFESVFETEDRGIGENEIFFDVINRIGKDKILVKKHPRSKVDIFEKMGLKVDLNSSVPFEVIHLVYDLSKCIFLTGVSSSVLGLNCFLEQPSKSILFYPITMYKKDKDLDKYISYVDSVMNSLNKSNKFNFIRVVHSKKELLEELSKSK